MLHYLRLTIDLDKVPEDKKHEAHAKFQDIAFAYAVLSDPKRRERYDLTGSTLESLSGDEDDFCWAKFFREQYKDVVTEESIEQFAKVYKGSSEERDDLLTAYTKSKGKWEYIYEVVMLSDPLEDEDRFRVIIDQAIKEDEVKSYRAYTSETQKSKNRRMNSRLKEQKELIEIAKAAGAEDLLKSSSGRDDAALKAMIMKNQTERSSFLDNLEAKYAPKAKASKKKSNLKKTSRDEPSEEAFLATRAKLEQQNETRRSKRPRNK